MAGVQGFQDDVYDTDTDSGAPSDEESGSEDDDSTWISWFCSLKGNEFFCEVDEDYIQDDFNLCGLQSMMPAYYDYALDVILDAESPNTDDLTDEQHEIIEGAAETLYGLIHHRYILTARGMQAMFEKYQNGDFGRCPRVYCEGQPCLPVALSDVFRQNTVKIFCPKCEDVYYPRSRYQGQVYGFKIHPTAYQRSVSRETNNRISRGRPALPARPGNGAAAAGNGNAAASGQQQEVDGAQQQAQQVAQQHQRAGPTDQQQGSERSQQQPATSNCTDMQQ